MASPPTFPLGRSSADGKGVVPRSSTEGVNSEGESPKTKRLSRKLFNLSDRIATILPHSAPGTLESRVTPPSVALSASPPLTLFRQPRSAPTSPPKGASWQNAAQTFPITLEQTKRHFKQLFQIIKEAEPANKEGEYHAVVYHPIFPHIRTNQIKTQTQIEVVKAIDVVLTFLETAINSGIEWADDEPLINLGKRLFQNPLSFEEMKNDPRVRDRWVYVLIEYKLKLLEINCQKALEMITSTLPSIRLICIALGVRQKKIIEEIKTSRIHPKDMKYGTLAHNEKWVNKRILTDLDLGDLYKDSKISMGYFAVMDRFRTTFFTDPEKIPLIVDNKYESSINGYISKTQQELTTFFEITAEVRKSDKEHGVLLHYIKKGIFLHYVEKGSLTELQSTTAEVWYAKHDYEKTVEFLLKDLCGAQRRNTAPLNSILSRLVQKGVRYLEACKLAPISDKEGKLPSVEEALKKIAQQIYPLLYSYLQGKMDESEISKNSEKPVKLPKQNSTNFDELADAFYKIERISVQKQY